MWQQCYFNSYLNISVVKLNQFNLLYAIGKIRKKVTVCNRMQRNLQNCRKKNRKL